MCRNRVLTVSALDQMLSRAASAQMASSSGAAGGDSAGSASPCNKADSDTTFRPFYVRLYSLLKFLGLPGPVSHWLPLQDIQLTDSRALQFSYACVAYEAAELILSYKPHAAAAAEGGFEHDNMAAFLVSANKYKAELAVEVAHCSKLTRLMHEIIKTRPREIGRSIVLSREVRCNWQSADTVGINASSLGDFTVYMQQLPVQGQQSSFNSSKQLSAFAENGISPTPLMDHIQNPSQGKFLAEALHAACGSHLAVVHCHIVVPKYTGRASGTLHIVPVWVLQWG